MKAVKIFLFLLFSIPFFITGCSHKLDVRDTSGFYQSVKIKDAPTVLITDMVDLRSDTNSVGKIGFIKFRSNIVLTEALADRLASRLMTKGYNVKKVSLDNMGETSVSKILRENNAEALISGKLYDFYFSAFDPVTRKTKGKSAFSVEIFDVDGNRDFEKNYTIHEAKCVGFTPYSGSEELMDLILTSSVDEVFMDKDFADILDIPEEDVILEEVIEGQQGDTLSLSQEIERLSMLRDSGVLTEKEFKKAKKKLLDN